MASITIQTSEGTRTLRAKVYGDVLAVHPSICADPNLFAITHLATGYSVNSALKGLDREKAEFFASRLYKLPLWDFNRPTHARRIAKKVRVAWKKINAEWNARRANAGESQPTIDRPEERQKKEVRV
jgi:hypothetical protein